MTGLELGLVYEPVAHEVGGGDVFGVWTLPSGAVAVLIGDVSGKGLEVAAASAMVRFFVEARAWDTECPAEVLAQANRILRARLRRGGFATAFLAVVEDGRLRYCNAGHPPPCLLRADGGVRGAAGQRAAARRRGGRPARGARGRRSSSATCCSPPPTGCSRRAARARSSATRGCRSCSPSTAARCRRRRSPSACSPRRRSGRRCSTTTSSCSRCGARPSSSCATSPRAARPRRRCTPSTWRSCASGSARLRPTEAIFATERAFEERARELRRALRPRAAGRLRRRALARPGAGRDQAHVRDGRRARPRPRPAAAGRARAARRRGRGAPRVRLLTTEVLTEARALYASAGYAEVEALERRRPPRLLAREDPGGSPGCGLPYRRRPVRPRRRPPGSLGEFRP